ncbi:MAG: hypothetical protein SNJ74_04370 [Fimbriimonadaceae bacterium]
MAKLTHFVLAVVWVALVVGCSGGRSDTPAEGSPAREAIEKGIPSGAGGMGGPGAGGAPSVTE